MAKKKEELSKAEMVREAIKTLGWDAGTTAYKEYIKTTFNVDMTPGHIAQTTSTERKKHGISRRKRRGGGRKKSEATPAAISGSGASSASVAEILAFVDTIRKWEGKIGAPNIREVVKQVLTK